MKNAARRKGVPILFCTPASNRADCAPLGPLHRPGFPESDLPRFERLLQSGASHAGLGDFEDAEREYLEALAMDSTHAGVLYRIGRLYLDEEGDQDGPPFLDQALLQDGVRLRASDRLLERIRAVASDEEARAVYLADTAERLRAESAGGAVGSDLVLEHIHPNGRGHYLIASEIFRILKAEGVLGAGAGRELSFTEASERVVYGPLEQAYVAGFMGFMLRRWPFQGTFRNENRIRWMEGEVRRARAEMDPVEGTIFDTRDEGETILHLYHRLGARYLELGEYEKAVRRLSTLVKVVPREPEAQLLLGRALLASGREEEARFALGEALHLGLSRETIASVDPRLAGFLPPPKP
jgi:tetratricopeptide (TPR) repeat protein